MSRPSTSISYTLDLGSDLSWCLSASGAARPWLERLASFWKLRAGSNQARPMMTFRWGPSAPGEGKPSEMLLKDDWKAVDLAYARIWSRPRVKDIVCELTLQQNRLADFSMTLAAANATYIRALAHGGLPVHGALIERNGVGALLCGVSGVGKSTCCRRLPEPWRAMSDDQALVLPDGSPGFRAHPFPTSSDLLWRYHGKQWDVQARFPLTAIFFLERACTDEVKPMGPGEASSRLNASANEVLGQLVMRLETVDRRLSRGRVFQNACEVSRSVRAYALNTSPGGRFWERIEEVVTDCRS